MRILIVDDLAVNRNMLALLAEREGHVPILASCAEEAEQAFLTHGADLIFLDVVMPGVDGYVVAERISQLCAERFVPIIFVTALQDEHALVRCLEYGDDYLVRPFNEDMFKAKLAAHIRTIELHRQTERQHEELNYLHQRLLQEQKMAEHVFDHASRSASSLCRNIKTYLSSASRFNGDVFLQAKSPGGGVYAMLGDFTGHGLPAALGSLPLAQTFKALTLKHLTVGALAREMNRVLSEFLPNHMFCAAVIAELKADGSEMNLWSGGLHETLILDAGSQLRASLPSQHMPLGILDDKEFQAEFTTHALSSGDKVVLYTDGILEATNSRGEIFGKKRFKDALYRYQCDIEKIRKGMHRFRSCDDEAEQEDDISIVVIDAGDIEFEGDQECHESAEAGWSDRPELPWSLELDLTSAQLRHGNPVSQLVDMVGEGTGLYAHKPALNLLLTELYNNALEHGVLGLDSALKDEENGMERYYSLRQERLADCADGRIVIRISHHTEQMPQGSGELEIEIKDSGKGFDVDAMTDIQDEASHGRGLSLVEQLAHQVRFTDHGRQVNVIYRHQY